MNKNETISAAFAIILLSVATAFADFGNSATYRMGVDVGAYSEAGSSSSYEMVIESALSSDAASSSSYKMALGWTAAAALVSAAEDLSFTIYIPANNATGRDTSQYAETDSIVFNITDVNGKKINATAAGGEGGQQTESISIFRYENTGTVALNITLNFTAGVPAEVTVKAGWSDASYQSSCSSKNLTAAGTCANISVGGAAQQPVLVANMTAVGAKRDVWLWADYDSYAAGSNLASTLSHSSDKG